MVATLSTLIHRLVKGEGEGEGRGGGGRGGGEGEGEGEGRGSRRGGEEVMVRERVL